MTRSSRARAKLNPMGLKYDIDADPKKQVVNLLYRNGILEALFIDPRPNEISKLDKVIDDYCNRYKNAAYIATQPAKNIFHMEMYTVEGTELEVPDALMDAGFKINVLSGNRFNKYKH